MTQRFATAVLWIVAAFYAYGALVYVLNILGVTGFDWSSAPLKWQVLDVVYLVLDLIVTIGLVRRWPPAYAAFYAAATSQILLYTVFRDWITSVPAEFARSPEEIAYLDMLVTFHVITIAAVSLALYVRHRVKA